MKLKREAKMGSYSEQDVIFLLKDLSTITIEKETSEREKAIQSGVHYSEMLPIEYKPSAEYLNLFHESLETYKHKVAMAVSVVAEQIFERKGDKVVLVSLARAGTPIGILIKRYLAYKYKVHVPHYSISIIRGRGIDENAIHYMLQKHEGASLQFVDGWTGKGAITKELTTSCAAFYEKYGVQLDDELAVLADPGFCSSLYGTREDFLIPSACLNSTVSGLVSRTVLNREYIGETDFHGAKYYKDLEAEDVSNFYVDSITAQFDSLQETLPREIEAQKEEYKEPNWSGLQGVERIQHDFQIENYHLIKPGVGETTRVLLRRVPWKILVKERNSEHLNHIYLLAKERGVPVEVYEHMPYSCCGLIKPVEEEK
ncbi:cysteine protease StiP family protein [Bacillus sp. CGMCC 1.16541]|uniref:cysteine protease StiP family protein n=1 Tax=Bacillus sp. CGMCC 1.16541 TaxID=2185143 RepID=UPI000D73A62B|nr:cysteine protease StiP family protein [Bacillus sp. CGMCC 1.16541]